VRYALLTVEKRARGYVLETRNLGASPWGGIVGVAVFAPETGAKVRFRYIKVKKEFLARFLERAVDGASRNFESV
jgi:hypothetical protein